MVENRRRHTAAFILFERRSTDCRPMNALMFGILGAVGAALYWGYTVFRDLALLQAALWSTVIIEGLIYAAAGFVGGVIGSALGKIGSGKRALRIRAGIPDRGERNRL